MLPKGTTITYGGLDSQKNFLGGYHGSLNYQGPNGKATVYYTVDVYSDKSDNNGIPVFDQSWQNVVATAYHELNEVRTDPDVEQYTTANPNLLGWVSNKEGAEVGDYPISGDNAPYQLAYWYEPLVNGQGYVPIQLLYSNAVHGPEDPTTIKFS